MRLAGLIGMLVGAAMVIGTYTGVLRGAGGDKNLGYTIGGLVAAYGLFRFLQGGRQR